MPDAIAGRDFVDNLGRRLCGLGLKGVWQPLPMWLDAPPSRMGLTGSMAGMSRSGSVSPDLARPSNDAGGVPAALCLFFWVVAFNAFDAADVEGLISSRAEKASVDLTTARDAWFGLLDPVDQPKGDAEVLTYFSSPGGWEVDPQADEKARRRQALYKMAGTYARTFASVAEDPAASGVNDLQIAQYLGEVERALALWDAVRRSLG